MIAAMSDAASHPSLLTVDLDAIAANYRLLSERLSPVPCAAVVKAGGYGLGLGPVARRLFQEGANDFFVATLDEGVALREILPQAEVHVLNGLLPGTEEIFNRHNLVPVLNDLGQIERWRRAAAERPLSAAIHLDTGMNRLGLGPDEQQRLAAAPDLLDGIHVRLWLSHFACADTPSHPLNAAQIADFRAVLARLPKAPVSLANSSGIFLGPEAHFDLGRPGVSLYGGAPNTESPNPLKQVVHLQGRILQVRQIDRGRTVGYGAGHLMTRSGRLATISLGYADGYLRYLSSRGRVFIGGREAPVVGRVSMDLISVDVTDVPEDDVLPGGLVEVIGPHQTIDDVAAAAGTIPYEILTSLGARYHRRYIGLAE